MVSEINHTERNRRYDAAQPLVRDQVDALLGMTTPNQSHDAGKPWKMDGIGRVINSNAKGMGQ